MQIVVKCRALVCVLISAIRKSKNIEANPYNSWDQAFPEVSSALSGEINLLRFDQQSN